MQFRRDGLETRRWTRATHCMLYTNVNAQSDKLTAVVGQMILSTLVVAKILNMSL